MKRILFAAVFPIFFSACTFRSAASLYNEGNELYREGRFTEAADCYKEALEKDPSPGLTARIYFNAGNASVKEALASSGESADLSSADSENRLRQALELYCLAQACCSESFAAAAVNAEWVRVRLSGSEQNSEEQNSEEQNSEEQNSDKNEGSSSDESDSAENKENSSGESEEESSEDSSEKQDSQENKSENSDRTNSGKEEDSVSEEENPGEGQGAASEEGEKDAFGQPKSEEDALSQEEAARMREAAELLEQEAAMRRQRPLFNRVPSYDDTERNW